MIPNIIHLIWFGSYPDIYLSNIRKWKELNLTFSVKLWTSSNSMYCDHYAQIQSFCIENKIELQDIDDTRFINYPNIEYIKQYLSFKLIDKLRFAAASDILRLAILEVEGGHYFDCDIEPVYSIEGINWQCQNGCYQLIDGTTTDIPLCNRYFQYCIMGAEPGNVLYKHANEFYRLKHAKLICRMAELIRSKNNTKEIATILFSKTGWILTCVARDYKIQPELVLMQPKLDFLDNLEYWHVFDGKLRGRVAISFDRSYMNEFTNYSPTRITTVFKPIVYFCVLSTILTTLASFCVLYGVAMSASASAKPMLK